MELEEAISKRKSIRSFIDEPISKEDIEKLLWAASKVPSAGGIHPFKIYVVEDEDLKKRLCKAGLNQKCIEEASVNLVVTVDYNRMVSRYGIRGYRYAYIEAGHIGQNISLMAISLGLGTVMIGAFRDGKVKEIMNIEEDPLYLIPVGRI